MRLDSIECEVCHEQHEVSYSEIFGVTLYFCPTQETGHPLDDWIMHVVEIVDEAKWNKLNRTKEKK